LLDAHVYDEESWGENKRKRKESCEVLLELQENLTWHGVGSSDAFSANTHPRWKILKLLQSELRYGEKSADDPTKGPGKQMAYYGDT
jgi:hypothetical protein